MSWLGYKVLCYHSPGWKTAGLHWKHSCQCQQGNASWTSWSDDDASVAACTWSSPSTPASTDRSRSGYRWSSLSEGEIEDQDVSHSLVLQNPSRVCWCSGPLTDNLRQCGGLQVQHDGALLNTRFEFHQAVQGQRGHMRLAPALATLLHLLLKLDPSGQKAQT